MPDAGKGFTLRFNLLMGGLVGVTFGGVWLFFCWNAARRYARLKAGKGIIARWTIDPTHWERFRQQSKEWDKIKGVHANCANLDQQPGAAGVEIVVTRTSMLLGEEFYPFETNVRIHGPVERVEFHERIYKRYGPPVPITYRIPLVPGGQQLRARILEAYSQPISTFAVTRRHLIYIFLIIVGGMAAITGVVTVVMRLMGFG